MLAVIVRNGSPRALSFFTCRFGREEMWLASNLGSIKCLQMCLKDLVKIGFLQGLLQVVTIVRLSQLVRTN